MLWGLLVLFAVAFTALMIRPPSPERSVAIFQNVGTLFYVICVLRLVRAEVPFREQPRASAKTLILPLLIGALVWSGFLSTYFISDDFGHLRAMASPLKKIGWDNLVFGQAHTFIRPLGFLSLALDYRVFHLWAPGFHIVSLLLHLVAVAGLFFFCRELRLPSGICSIAALLYAVLPINAEAIGWLACRFDQIATPAMLWSLVAYVRFRRSGRISFLLLALFLFLTAVFSKESAYVLPFIVLLLELLILRPPRLLPVGFLFILAGACFLYRVWVFGGIGGYREPSGASSVLHVHGTTFKGLFLRAPAEMLFGLNWVEPTARTTLIIAAAIAAVLFTLLAFPMREHGRFGWFALAWILFAPIPAHSMVRVGADLGNSRELYFASAGAALLLALLLQNVTQVHLQAVFCVLLTILFACGARHNIAAWRYDSAMSRSLLAEITALYPHPVPGTEFVIDNLPRAYRGIYFFQTGLDDAIKLRYGRSDVGAMRSSEAHNSSLLNKMVVNICWTTDVPDRGKLAPCPTAVLALFP